MGCCNSWWYRHRVAIDIVTAGGFVLLDTGLTLVGATWWPARPGTLAWVMLGLQAVACATLAVRRHSPLAVVAILSLFTLALTLLIWPVGALTPEHAANVWAPFATVPAAYAPFFYQGNRRAALVSVAVLTIIVARPWQPSAMVITVGLLRTAAGPLLAMYYEARRRLVLALTERAERAERERHLLAEQARAEERARLAGEMHDVVTHRVSLMVLQAGALRLTAADEATRQAAEELRAAGCQALDELRDLVGILRTAPDPDQTPSMSDFAALVAESTGVGTPAELVEEGDPALASPVVGRTAYRIVREALTNVRKHAPGAQVVVRVSYEESSVQLSVRNAPPPRPPGGARPGSSPTAAALASTARPSTARSSTARDGTARDGTARSSTAWDGTAWDSAAWASTAWDSTAWDGAASASTAWASTVWASTELAATGSGLGIAGLRQRVELVHGSLRAGGTADGGFCVEATLPAYVPTPETVA